MKIIVIGATGIIGSAIVKELSKDHEVIPVGFSKGPVTVDLTDESSIKAMYDSQQNLDAVVCATGRAPFAPLEALTAEDYHMGLHNKLMGQINLVRHGIQYLNDRGSFTLTSGILNIEPIYKSTVAAVVNGGLEGFVTSASQEMPRGLRLNCVSPTLVTEAKEAYGDTFKGYKTIPVADAALAYRKSVDNLISGKILRAGY